MSTATEDGPPGTSLAPTADRLWRSARGPLVVVGLVLATAVVLAALGGGARAGFLDPRAVNPAGSRAVAEVLRSQGIEVTLVTRTDEVSAGAGPGDTVLVVQPDLLRNEQAAAVTETGADLVVVGSTDPGVFSPAVSKVSDAVDVGETPPGCAFPAATRAGTVDAGGVSYDVATDAATEAFACYASEGRPSMVGVQTGTRLVTFLGSPEPLTNERFDDLGNASLVLSLLGAHPRLLWYLPSLADTPPDGGTSFYELVPKGVWWGLAQAVVAVLLLMLWRARRLGPVVREPLPVVVRAAETVEGRARLYRRARARDKAGDSLRAGTRSRLIGALGLPRAAGPQVVVDAAAARTTRTPVEVAALLYGAAPADDPALVRLADDLDALEREISRP